MPLNRLCFIIPAGDSDEAKRSPDRRSKQPEGINQARRLPALVRRSLHRFCRRRCFRQDSSRFEDTPGVNPTNSANKVGTAIPHIFSYAELYIGTSGFSAAELLGSGGFGHVYRAVLPGDGTVAAVKCVAAGRGGETFAAELAAVAQLRHHNLVRLRGWCVHDGAQLLLVYDYMPNRSLDRFLFSRAPLAWKRRRRVVAGLAAALFYLHEQLNAQIIHRDVKASNVMLDAGFNARLGDFGLARWLEHDDELSPLSLAGSSGPFRISETSRIGGTFGYLPPESFQRRGAATAKSDVFGFGIVALEVATGRRAVDLATGPHDEIFMLDWVRQLADEGRCLDAGDQRLMDGSFPLSEMSQLIHIGLLCSLNDPNARPTMKWVVAALAGEQEGDLPALPSFRGDPQYFSLSSTTTTTTATNDSSDFVTAGGPTVFLSVDNSVGSSGDKVHQQLVPSFSCIEMEMPREIPFEEILAITDGFSESRVVAELDFGTGYDGFLEKRFHVLVKRMGISMCPILHSRFSEELRSLSRLRHRHLVQLRGWCAERGEMIVVYDYSSGAPLSCHLFHRPALFTWRHRYAAVKALASAVCYLHEEQMLHRNITSAAVLLDPKSMNPRLGSFTLAEFLSRNKRSVGLASARWNFGYMSPEYVTSGEETAAADVYGFGVVVLEVVTGQPAVDFRSPEVLLVRKARRFEARRRPVAEIVDRALEGRFDEAEVARLVRLGLACTRSDPVVRPCIRKVCCILNGNDELLKMVCGKRERREEWEGRNATALSSVRRIQALGIH